MNKSVKYAVQLLTVSALTSLAACGGGGSDDAAPVFNLTGTWGGKYDYSGIGSSLSVGINEMSVTSVSRDGVDQYLTGAITPLQGNTYEFVLYSGSAEADSGGFLLDNLAMHAGFLTSGGDFGVLQRYSNGSASWTTSDIVGTWSGYSIALDYNGNITSYGNSAATVDSNGDITGSGPFGNFTAAINYYSSSNGWYDGTWSNPSQNDAGYLKIWVSADKSFAASYACSGYSTTPAWGLDSCTYNSWTKQ